MRAVIGPMRAGLLGMLACVLLCRCGSNDPPVVVEDERQQDASSGGADGGTPDASRDAASMDAALDAARADGGGAGDGSASDGAGATDGQTAVDSGMDAAMCTRHLDCDDGLFCNGEERCSAAGLCQSGSAPTVDDGVACTVDSCDEGQRQVVHEPDHAQCDDDDPCTRDICDDQNGCETEPDTAVCPCLPSGTCTPFEAGSCPSGQACRPGLTAGDGASCGDIGAPELGEGGDCSGTVNDRLRCGDGLACVDFGLGAQCLRMCPAASVGYCGADQACIGTVGLPCIHFCRPINPRCDIYDQNCADTGDTCTLDRHPETGERYTGCRPAGPQGRDEPCGGSNGTCGHGLICVAGSCRQVCDAEDGDPACSDASQQCDGVSATYGITFCV